MGIHWERIQSVGIGLKEIAEMSKSNMSKINRFKRTGEKKYLMSFVLMRKKTFDCAFRSSPRIPRPFFFVGMRWSFFRGKNDLWYDPPEAQARKIEKDAQDQRNDRSFR